MRTIKAFTLVELLVVIGIIAILVGILLPTLNRVRDQSAAVACSAQLRGIGQGLMLYASEYRSSLPWGHRWAYASGTGTNAQRATAATTPNSFAFSDGNYNYFRQYSWVSSINHFMKKNEGGGLWPIRLEQPATLENQFIRLSGAWICPSVKSDDAYTDTFGVRNTYGFNMVAMPNYSWETNGSASKAQYAMYSPGSVGVSFTVPGGWTGSGAAPAKLGQLYPDNALIWETAVMSPGNPNFYIAANLGGGIPLSNVDSASLMFPNRPGLRYRGGDFKPLFPEERGDLPIWMPTFKGEKDIDIGINLKWVNNDYPAGLTVTPHYPNYARFRHNRDTVCNVLFADGSVRGLKINRNKVAYTDSEGIEISQSEFIRNMLRIKRPPFQPSPINANYP